MRVVSLIAWAVRLRLKRPVKHALFERTATENVVVRCQLADGSIGWGEGLPREYVTGETVETCLATLRSTDLSRQFAGECATWPDAVRLADRFELPAADDRASNAARCAVELAVLDAFGRHFREPIQSSLAILAPDVYQPRPRVRYSGAIMGSTGRKLRFAAVAMRIAGFEAVKLKVGVAGQDDVARFRAARRYLPASKIRMYIDANEAWSRANVADRLSELMPFQPAVVEQPVPDAELDVLAEIRRGMGVRIALDESTCTPGDVERAVARQAVDVVNVKLSKCGGWTGAVRTIVAARRHGLNLQMSCQVGESALSSIAGRRLASAIQGVEFLEGSYDRFLLKDNLTRRGARFGYGGWAAVPTEPGIGVDVDPEQVARLGGSPVTLL